jgi:galactokinase
MVPLLPLHRAPVERCDPKVSSSICRKQAAPAHRMIDIAGLRERFRARFGTEPRIFRAPGRTNLIGEHTDYNDGFVMPAALEYCCWIAAGRRADRRLALHSENLEATSEVDLSSSSLEPAGAWSDYATGVAVMLARAGFEPCGADLLIHSDVPTGAGLSSSAAFEVATACALVDLSGISVDRKRLAQLCQQAENEFVGVRCGVMDQFTSLHGQAGHALLLDCRSLEFEQVPLPPGVALVLCNTGVNHKLAGGEYNRRRADCEDAVRGLAAVLPGIRALRDVSPEQLEQHKARLPEKTYRRARHVVLENMRVIQAAQALRQGDLERFGTLMQESHASLRDLYEVSCPELDMMVELAHRQRGVYGARMTGGGFGGCTVNLVEARYVEGFRREIARAYEEATRIRPEIYECAPGDAAGAVTVG